MYELKIDGRLQVTAGVSLLESSRLVHWDTDVAQFIPVSRDTFEFSWRRDVDPVFGRLICWVNFSAGAEFLAKGLCLLHRAEVRTTHCVPTYPSGDLAHWASEFTKDPKFFGTVKTTHFGTLGDLTRKSRRTNATAALLRLCRAVRATQEEEDLLMATYELLAQTIRNRDAHAYVPNVRDDHFSLVQDLFARCFNLLVTWLPNGASTLNSWRDEARQFASSL